MNHSVQLNNVVFRWVKRGLRVGLIAALLLLSAGATPVRADTSVCGPISVDTTWTVAGNNYIVTCLVQVMQGVTLTIEPGVRVYFNAGTGLRIDGELIAHGVTFMSNSSTLAPGDWSRIFFMATSVDAVFDPSGNYLSGSIIQDSTIVYGGGGVDGALITYGASPYIKGNSIISNANHGIHATGRSANQPVVIEANYLTFNQRGGIFASLGKVVGNTIQGNETPAEGGGITAISSVIMDNQVLDNLATLQGGGIYAEGSAITNNTVTGNTSRSVGGGIYTSGGTLTGNTISGNFVTSYDAHGGGVYASSSTLTKNTVDGNTASENHPWYSGSSVGAGIYAYLSNMEQNVVTNNTAISWATYAYGGGIYTVGGMVTNNTVTGNTASTQGDDTQGFGGGIYADGGTVTGNTIRNNTATGGGSSKGGGLYSHINTSQDNSLTGNSANMGGAIYAFKGTVSSNTVLTNTTALSGTLYIEQGTATLNILRANTAAAGGALYGVGATLTGNTAEENSANFGAGIYALNSTVRGNTLQENHATSDGGGLYAILGTVTNNTLTGNSVPAYGHGSGAYLDGVTDFSYNDVLTNTASGGTTGGISLVGQPLVQYNNLYGNLPYDAEVISAEPVTGTLNYWGLSACIAIPGQIYDGKDAPGRGELSYAPSLYTPVPVAQLTVPSNLRVEKDASGVTLFWDAIPVLPAVGCRVPGASVPDWGYKLYYDADACAPFDGEGLAVGVSPVDLGQVTSFSPGSLPGVGLMFAVTAYDYLGREGAFSNQVWVASDKLNLFLPMVLQTE